MADVNPIATTRHLASDWAREGAVARSSWSGPITDAHRNWNNRVHALYQTAVEVASMQTLVEAEPTETELELVHSTETTVRVLTGNAEAEYKAGDSDPPLRAELLGPTGPVDLSGATVTISLHSFGEVVVDAAPVEVLDGPAGRVEYDWETVGADLALEGLFDAEFRVETADDDHLSFPNTGYLPVRISADV